MKKKDRRPGFKTSIRFRMMFIFLAFVGAFIVFSIYNYTAINKVIDNINKVYSKNFILNELEDELKSIQKCVTEYLYNKNTNSAEEYYKHVHNYQEMMEALNDNIVNEKFMIMEKNIKNISVEYLRAADKTIEYKRGRNVVKYKAEYAKTKRIEKYIISYIDKLNNLMLKANTINHQSMIDILDYTQKISFVVLIVIGIMSIVVIYVFTSRITEPLTRLASAANVVAKGNLDIEPVRVTTEDELGVVTVAFNQMLNSIREYIQKVTENMERERTLQERELLMVTHLKEAQLNYLQAQINPHFLFNTLNAGTQLAMIESADRTYEYIRNVAEFYRYIVKNSNMVTLKEEIELVDSYMYIINVRFANEITYTKNIDESLTYVQVPAMILQPLVENSIKHGLSDIEWNACITIELTKRDDYVCVKVYDNGVGIPKEVIWSVFEEDETDAIMNSTENGGQKTKGVGLRNVYTRMRLFYDCDNIMEITSEGEGMGTCITLLIPDS